MLRREFLAGLLTFPLTSKISQSKPLHGWIPGYQHYSLCSFTDYQDLGKGRVACLWEPWEIIHGPLLVYPQQWMDCVARSAGLGLDLLTAIENHPFRAAASSDMIYAGGREGDRAEHGMHGIQAVKWLTHYGKLLRIKYPPYNLIKYSKRTCRYWDRRGVPKSLKIEAKKTPLLKYIHIRNWNQCRNAVASGHLILFCSSLGAQNNRRDKDGFIIPKGTWCHAWLLAGIDDGKRPGACLINPHGSNWASGPKRHYQPDGSVWIDKRYIDYQLRNFRDSYALCSVEEKGKRQFFPWIK